MKRCGRLNCSFQHKQYLKSTKLENLHQAKSIRFALHQTSIANQKQQQETPSLVVIEHHLHTEYKSTTNENRSLTIDLGRTRILDTIRAAHHRSPTASPASIAPCPLTANFGQSCSIISSGRNDGPASSPRYYQLRGAWSNDVWDRVPDLLLGKQYLLLPVPQSLPTRPLAGKM